MTATPRGASVSSIEVAICAGDMVYIKRNDEYTARNNAAMKTLVEKHQVKLRALPPEVMAELKRISIEVIDEMAANDPSVDKVYQAYKQFQIDVKAYHEVSEKEYLINR